TIVPVGSQTLQASFTPADLLNFRETTVTRQLTVIDSSTGVCVARPQGLVGWGSAEGDGVDRTGHHPATLVDGVAFAPGRVGHGFSFAAPQVSALAAISLPGLLKVTVPPSPSLDLTSLTIQGWVLFNELPSGFGTIVAKQATTDINYSLFVTSW